MGAVRGVYFLKQGARIKIGWSCNIEARLRPLKTMAGEPMELLGCILNCDRSLEAYLHVKFAAFRETGEWFRPVQQLMLYIKKNAVQQTPNLRQYKPRRHEPITADETRSMLAQATKRQACYIKFLWATGCHVSELAVALVENIGGKGQTPMLRVMGWAGKERVVNVSSALLGEISSVFGTGRYLFQTSTGKAVLPGYVSHQVASLGRRVLGRKISAATFMHSKEYRKARWLEMWEDEIL